MSAMHICNKIPTLIYTFLINRKPTQAKDYKS
jgi:hypothetical protein